MPGKTKEGQAMINHKIPMSSLGAKTFVPQMTVLFRSLFFYTANELAVPGDNQ